MAFNYDIEEIAFDWEMEELFVNQNPEGSLFMRITENHRIVP